MMTSPRPRGDVGGSFASRRGHSNKLSISDPSHHVTEAIGTLYDDEDDYPVPEHLPMGHRPLSFVPSQHPEEMHKSPSIDSTSSEEGRRPLLRSTSDMTPSNLGPHGSHGPKKSQTVPARLPSRRGHSYEHTPKSPLSPALSLKDVQAEASQFPLTNIDNPNDIAQELSNLQALRRMSMDVGNTSDPDLLPFSGMSLMAMPSIAPTGDDDEADPSRLLWVPARVHPEIAPMEFKSFLEKRVQSIKRRSGDSFLSTDSAPERSNSAGLRRKKSMLSRQIDETGGAAGYVDGAERLGRKRSSSGLAGPELTLDELVKDPTKAVQKLAQESTGSDADMEDMPILPVAPGMGLRRSTRTTYRKGGSLRGEKVPFSKRIAARQAEAEAAEDLQQALDAPKGHTLARVQSEPVTENYSRPTRSVRRQQKFSQESPSSLSSMDGSLQESVEPSATSPTRTFHDHLPVRTASAEGPYSSPSSSVPQIVETPPTEPSDNQLQAPRDFPQRSSSQKASAQMMSQQSQQFIDEPPARSSKRPPPGRSAQTSPSALQQPSGKPAGQTLNDMASHPAQLPGGGATRTDSLTFIPTYSPEDKKHEKKSKKDKDEESSVSSSKSTSWKWFKSGTDDKEKRRKEEESKRSKAKALVEKAQDNVRLDVLQTSIETAVAKGRESLLLDRESIDNKLHEERKKESNRKVEAKKERDGNIFTSFFGGKKKSEKDGSGKKGHHLRVSEDAIYRPLRPDVDYHWTRFPLLEERAIYRMAHIKLANPRRSLHSQVLLSNFMYNYLAIVQAMHPQMQIPVSPQQKRLDEERRRKEQEQQFLAEQQQQMQEQASQENMDRYNYDYHRDANNYGDGHSGGDGVEYLDDAQIYEYEHGGEHDEMRDQGDGYGANDGYHQGKDYYSYGHHNGDGGRQHSRDDMW